VQLNALKVYDKSAPEEEEKAWSFVYAQKRGLDYAARHTRFFKARLCLKHPRHLARALHMVINDIDRSTLVKRLAKVASNAQSKTDWTTANVNSERRAAWFCHGNRAPKQAPVQNRLHPFQYKAEKYALLKQWEKDRFRHNSFFATDGNLDMSQVTWTKIQMQQYG
jgi:hypothetical protein